jgi:dihydroorotate dehydrogenase
LNYPLFRKLLFRLEPEQAHALSLQLIRWVGLIYPANVLLKSWFRPQQQPVSAFGLQFKNPIGLAAGYDKDGLGWRGLACLGFGHIEIGTVTPKPQTGNPAPRLFRLPEEYALINRMGFPGKGSHFVARQLRGQRPPDLILGVNLGKNKDTPLEESVTDYLSLYDQFAPLADYLAINVSSPNTFGLRRLQARENLEQLLSALADRRQQMRVQIGRHVPVLVKLAPDLTFEELEDAVGTIMMAEMDGVIATNTTISREGLPSSRVTKEVGGLSGQPLRERSTQIVRQISELSAGQLPIIGVGGISSATSARQKLDAGAVLVQVYTALVYAGPSLVKQILAEL